MRGIAYDPHLLIDVSIFIRSMILMEYKKNSCCDGIQGCSVLLQIFGVDISRVVWSIEIVRSLDLIFTYTDLGIRVHHHC